MNIDRIAELVSYATQMYRKGETVVETLPGVTEVWLVDPVPSAPRPNQQLVDVHFAMIGVDMYKAAVCRIELYALLAVNPRFSLGPSYIEVGVLLGDQGLALGLFALGEVAGLWTLVTPERLGMAGEAADQMAGMGMIMPDGLRAP